MFFDKEQLSPFKGEILHQTDYGPFRADSDAPKMHSCEYLIFFKLHNPRLQLAAFSS